MKSILWKKSKIGQTTIELALFGSVLIFLIGVIVRVVFVSGQSQDQNYKAFRLALTTSFKYSEGLIQGVSSDGNASHNSASVLLIEDRLSVTSAKHAALDRMPFIVSGSGTHSRNLFYPTDYLEYASLTVTDYFVNGVHIPLTIAGFGARTLTDIPGTCATAPNAPYTIVPNHPALPFDDGCGPCFDLDRDGTEDVIGAGVRSEFMWQWQFIPPGVIDIDNGENTVVDIDCDLKEERILERTNNSVRYIDSQEGDIDPTINDRDIDEGALPQGLTGQDANIFTFASNPAGGGGGTYLQIDQGRLYSTNGITRQFVRSAQKKDSLDIIQRVVRLNRNTGHFCSGPNTVTTSADPTWGWAWSAANPNPVDVCVPDSSQCFGPNAGLTCMVTSGDIRIFVRSSLANRQGRQWVTDTEGDPSVNFVVPAP